MHHKRHLADLERLHPAMTAPPQFTRQRRVRVQFALCDFFSDRLWRTACPGCQIACFRLLSTLPKCTHLISNLLKDDTAQSLVDLL